MRIEIDKKDYEILLKNVAIGNWVHGIMGDMVDSKYKKESSEGDNLIDKILEHVDDKTIKDKYDGKNVFTDDYMNGITDFMSDYENYVVDDLTGIDMEQVEAELEAEEKNPLFMK